MSISVKNLNVTFGDTVALDQIDLTIEKGECVALLGPSGCGKSTLLNTIGGLQKPTQGSVTFNGAEVVEPDPHRAAFIFQDYSLLPWKSALDNVAFGLRLAGVSKEERNATARKFLAMVGLGAREDALPGQLSGGMQQRVAVARALAVEPDAVLMDEPFGALDEMTRRAIGVSVAHLLAARDVTVALVTHSIDEAIFWADRVVVMGTQPGHIVADVRIEGERPRTEEFYVTERFAQLRAELFGLISEVTPKVGLDFADVNGEAV